MDVIETIAIAVTYTTDSEILDNNHKVDNLNLAIANCCSITNKQVELKQFLISHQVDIFLGTESHLDSSILNAEVFPNHYNVYRKDRNKYEVECLLSSEILSHLHNSKLLLLMKCFGFSYILLAIKVLL